MNYHHHHLARLVVFLFLSTTTAPLAHNNNGRRSTMTFLGNRSDDYTLCMKVAVCRSLYDQSAAVAETVSGASLFNGEIDAISIQRFERESESRANKIQALLGTTIDTQMDTDQRLVLYEHMLIKAVLDESKCPPNSFWMWSPEKNQAVCQCYLDRDCRVSTTTVCRDTTSSPFFILLSIIAVLLFTDIAVRIITDRYQQAPLSSK